jgi:hypothetical protein
MRRLLIILLLTLLPIQAACAAVCAFCPDNCVAMSASGDAASDGNAFNAADDCNVCHSVGIALLPAPQAARHAPLPHKLSLFDSRYFPDSGKPVRPERPKWKRAA